MLTLKIPFQALVPAYYVCSVITVLLLMLMMVIHVFVLFGMILMSLEVFVLFVIPFIVIWVLALFVARLVSYEYRSRDFIYAMSRGCPRWLTRTAWILTAYAILNLVLFKYIEWRDPASQNELITLNHYRAVSSVAFPFLIWSLVMFVSAVRIAKNDPARRCANGHAVMPRAKFCEQCGVAIEDQLGSGRNGPDSTGD